MTSNSTMLHMIFSSSGWQKAQPMIQPHDTVLLGGSAIALSAAVPTNCALYVLATDCQQVGVQAPHTAQAISDDAWVDLVMQHAQRVNWA
ncbi:DsrH/TusB family sulfur relay protein [Salinispirillum sp. LH 10-3-1]|uniref:DsrH/TusB family sulfur relay protein n=1 Tax=Salinispirillum sp. LH 10-3-1 TaxID=2952525 RepID=A0AB38YJW6_9GAMM